jgi:uncharacterized membrane protein
METDASNLGNVLGSTTGRASQDEQPSLTAGVQALTASPYTYFTYFLFGLMATFAALLLGGLLPISRHLPHVGAVAGGAALVAAVLTLMIVNKTFIPGVQVDPSGSVQTASVDATR